MTELKREEFQGTWFNTSKWTEKQKVKFQLKCFELGYRWLGHEELPQELDAARYFLSRNCITYADNQYDSPVHNVEKFYEDMFPNYEAPKSINVVEEITQLFVAEMDKGDFEECSEEDEDERGFEGLVYVEPEPTGNYYILPLDGLSEEQSTFLNNTLDFHPHSGLGRGEVAVGLASLKGKDNWFFCTSITSIDTRISFNDLFKYEDEL